MRDHIVLIEDNDGHAQLIESNLRDTGIANPVTRFTNGYDALDALLPEGEQSNTPLLAIIDLNMPGMHGTELLARFRSDARTKSLPLVVLTTSANSAEVTKCYELGCNLYLAKPNSYLDFEKAIRTLGVVLQLVRFPNTAAR